MFEIGTQLWISRSHGYLEVCSKSPKVRDTDISLYFINVFLLFFNYPPFEKGQGPSFEHTWIPLTQGCFVPSLVEIGPVVLEEKILNFIHVFLYFLIISPWKGRGSSFEVTWIPFTKDTLCQVWLKLVLGTKHPWVKGT